MNTTFTTRKPKTAPTRLSGNSSPSSRSVTLPSCAENFLGAISTEEKFQAAIKENAFAKCPKFIESAVNIIEDIFYNEEKDANIQELRGKLMTVETWLDEARFRL